MFCSLGVTCFSTFCQAKRRVYGILDRFLPSLVQTHVTLNIVIKGGSLSPKVVVLSQHPMCKAEACSWKFLAALDPLTMCR